MRREWVMGSGPSSGGSTAYVPQEAWCMAVLDALVEGGSDEYLSRKRAQTGEEGDYGLWKRKLCSADAWDSVRSLRRFVDNFSAATSKIVEERKELLSRMRVAPWKFQNGDSNKHAKEVAAIVSAFVDEAAEGMGGKEWCSGVEDVRPNVSRFVHEKIHDRCWEIVEDSAKDKEMAERISELGFLSFEHLEIQALAAAERESGSSADIEEDMWQVPLHELKQMDSVRSPSEKLGHVFAASRAITAAITAAMKSAGSESLPGADDFLPALILAVAHSNPPRLQSNLEYMQAFCDESAMRGEGGYLVTNLYSAAQFLMNLDASSLNIGREEFSEGVGRCRRELEARAKEAGRRQRGDEAGQERLRDLGLVEGKTVKPVTAREIREMREKGRLGEFLTSLKDRPIVYEDDTLQPTLPLPKSYRFLGATPSTLRLSDLPPLLTEYHRLAKALETLKHERTTDAHRQTRARLEAEKLRLQQQYDTELS